MKTTTTTSPRPLRTIGTVTGLGLVTAMLLAGCSPAEADDNGGGNGAGSSVAWGASAEEYAAALADMDPVVLKWVGGTSAPAHPRYLSQETFIEDVERYSGGKISLEYYAAGEVVPITEGDLALIDGRLDIASVWPQYNVTKYPANNLSIAASMVRDPRLITGTYSLTAAMQEVMWNTPEIIAEWTDQGITPLSITALEGPTGLYCSEPLTTLDDLNGKQIGSGSTIAARTIEALGAIPVSLTFSELYEALQRGIVDCTLNALVLAPSVVEVAPYFMYPSQVSFYAEPVPLMAGPSFKNLPPEAQQMFQQINATRNALAFSGDLTVMNTRLQDVQTEAGGGLFSFDPEVDARLIELNEQLFAELEETTLTDGASFAERVLTANDKWVALVQELGYADAGPINEFWGWADPEAWANPDPWANATIEEFLHLSSDI